MPKAPENWKEMRAHPYQQKFEEAAHDEYDSLKWKQTWEEVPRKTATAVMKPLPLKWVFSYKVDSGGFVTKFKVRLCVRGDLQPENELDNYASTISS